MRYLALLIAAITSVEVQAFQYVPRLIVNITIDQLRTDYMEAFYGFYAERGFKRLMKDGRYYDHVSYPFKPVDRSSATATLATGASPFYNGIVGNSWLNRETLQPILSTDDEKHKDSPARLKTSTLSDELKVATAGKAFVYSFAAHKDAAILLAGHAADGAFWIEGKQWTGSDYYRSTPEKWIKEYNKQTGKNKTRNVNSEINDCVVDISLQAIEKTAIGQDDIPDLMYVTLSATTTDKKAIQYRFNDIQDTYKNLDTTLGKLIDGVEKRVGAERVLFVVTSTGYYDEKNIDLNQFRIPTGTFYINRTASLLNMYLSAIYGSGRYVSQCFNNQIYLNLQLIEQKRISLSELLKKCQSFLFQNAGVADVYTSERLLSGSEDVQKLRSGFNPTTSGDIIIEVSPGWKLLNEDTQQSYTNRIGDITFPVFFLGNNIAHEHISLPVTADRITPTLARAIRIRAPNACASTPLF